VTATCNRGYTFDTVSLQPMLVYLPCQQNCQYAEPPACQPKSCGTFALAAGLVAVPRGASVHSPAINEIYNSAGWSAGQVYVHGDKLKVVCLASHRVRGTDCQSSYDIMCDDGAFVRRDDASAAFEPCEAVECLDGAPCGACPTYSQHYGDDKVIDWEPRTQRVCGEKLEVRCMQGYHARIVPLQNSVFRHVNCSRNESIAIAATGSLSSCQDPKTYEALCRPTGWESEYRCVPIACHISHVNLFSGLEHPERVEAVEYMDENGKTHRIVPVDRTFSRHADRVVLEGVVNVTCREGYRPGSHHLAAPRWQLLQCHESCAFSTPLPCLPVACSNAHVPQNALPLSPGFFDGAAAAVMSYEEIFEMHHGDTISFACNKGYSLESWNVSEAVGLQLGSSLTNSTLEWTPCTTLSTVTCHRGQLLGEQECVPLSRECRTCPSVEAYPVILADEIDRRPSVAQKYRPGVDIEQNPTGGAKIVGLQIRTQASYSDLAIGDTITAVDNVIIASVEGISAALLGLVRGSSVLVTRSRPGSQCSSASPCILHLARDVAVPLPPVVPPASIVHSIINDGSEPYLQPYTSGESLQVQCHSGYHARPKNESEARCLDTDSYTLVCSDGQFTSSGRHGQRCMPHRCVPFANWSLDGNIDQVKPAASMLGAHVNVTCKPGFRPRMANPLLEFNLTRPMRLRDPKWFIAKCLEDCSYDVPHDVCVPIFCPVPAHSRVVEHDRIVKHRELFTLQCDLGYNLARTQCLDEAEGCLDDNRSHCASWQTVLCWDGALNHSDCRPKMPCGCGSAACSVDNTSVFSGMLFGRHVASWSVVTDTRIVPYGRAGFWSRSITFDDEPGRFSHLVNFSATCAVGHRPVFKGSSHKSTCATPPGFGITCNDCTLAASKTCVPVECPAFHGLDTANTINISSGSSLFKASRLVTCDPYARAMHVQSQMSENACAAPQAFNISCNAECSWDSHGMSCMPLFCVPYSVYTQDPNVNTSLLNLRADPQEQTQVFCNFGFRAGSPLPNTSTSFDVVCQSDCSYTPGKQCHRVTCGVLQLPPVSLTFSPAPYLPTSFDFQEQVSV